MKTLAEIPNITDQLAREHECLMVSFMLRPSVMYSQKIINFLEGCREIIIEGGKVLQGYNARKGVREKKDKGRGKKR